jgi:hypothetical protein
MVSEYFYPSTTFYYRAIKSPASIGNKKAFQHFFITTLSQIYLVLSHLRGQFVHNDLHLDNVLLTPVESHDADFITLHYHHDSAIQGAPLVTTFKTNYYTKLIDYGRCYTRLNEQLIEQICEDTKCGPDCGNKFGFQWYLPTLEKRAYYISARVANPSIDLKLFDSVSNLGGLYPDATVLFQQNIDDPQRKVHGTSPVEDNQDANQPITLIRNVTDASNWIRQWVASHKLPPWHARRKLGDLHIYVDGTGRPMEFVRVT